VLAAHLAYFLTATHIHLQMKRHVRKLEIRVYASVATHHEEGHFLASPVPFSFLIAWRPLSSNSIVMRCFEKCCFRYIRNCNNIYFVRNAFIPFRNNRMFFLKICRFRIKFGEILEKKAFYDYWLSVIGQRTDADHIQSSLNARQNGTIY
jgi:hypothetical protein